MMDTITRAIQKYGAQTQSIVCMEELAELQKEISKFLRGKGDKQHLTEEIADVKICIAHLIEMYAIDGKELEDAIDYKLRRLEDRMINGV